MEDNKILLDYSINEIIITTLYKKTQSPNILLILAYSGIIPLISYPKSASTFGPFTSIPRTLTSISDSSIFIYFLINIYIYLHLFLSFYN